MSRPGTPLGFAFIIRSTTCSLLLCLLLPTIAHAAYDPQADQQEVAVSQTEYTTLKLHLGYENEVSATRVNYPFRIQLTGQDWRVYNEQFRQLGELADLWDQARQGQILLQETRNVPLPGEQTNAFSRQVRIIRTSWAIVGQKCGYKKNGQPHSGCAFNKRLPKCTVVVPHQPLYANGDINEYHQLLGHEMWHCIVGSFH